MSAGTCPTCGGPVRVEGDPVEGTMHYEPAGDWSKTEEGWAIMQDAETRSMTVYRANGFAADSEGPTLYTRDEFERFISNLRHAAATIWPDA